MKIKPEHLELLRSKITHLDTEKRRLIYFNGLNRRYRWDLLYESKVMSEIDLYKYLNDNHIDTALRTIVKTI